MQASIMAETPETTDMSGQTPVSTPLSNLPGNGRRQIAIVRCPHTSTFFYFAYLIITQQQTLSSLFQKEFKKVNFIRLTFVLLEPSLWQQLFTA